MDNRILKPSVSCATGSGSFQNVQPKFVPFQTVSPTALTRTTVTAKAQQPVFLKYILANAKTTGYVNDFRIGNQSLNCSDSDIDFSLLSDFSQRVAVVGVAVDGNIQMSLDVTLDGSGPIPFSAGFSCEKIDKAMPIVSQCQDGYSSLNRFFGMGKVTLANDATGQLSAQALRDCRLLDLVLTSHTVAADASNLHVTDITIAGVSIYSGQSGASLSIAQLSQYAQKELVAVNTAIETNQRVIVTIQNKAGIEVTIGGGWFAE